ncbi:MAG: respiratory nitrate reductase subunit gamma [Desulfobacteraceae bacterium]|nr:respiratory nitrate reductase subunit gamma [Desulfobacteraceae bacterium]
MHALLTGPIFYLSLGVCIIGMIVRFYQYFNGLSWQLDRVAYKQWPARGFKGAIRSIYKWLIPYGTYGWRAQPVMTAAFFGFHIGAVFIPLFLVAHNVFLQEKLGISWFTISTPMADILTWIAVASLCLLILRRLVLPEVRILTDKKDWGILIMSMAPFVTGLLARYQVGDYSFWLNAHILTGEIVLFAIPFTKLSHVFLFFASRAQLGMDFGIKRGGVRGTKMAW